MHAHIHVYVCVCECVYIIHTESVLQGTPLIHGLTNHSSWPYFPGNLEAGFHQGPVKRKVDQKTNVGDYNIEPFTRWILHIKDTFTRHDGVGLMGSPKVSTSGRHALVRPTHVELGLELYNQQHIGEVIPHNF